MKGIGKSIGILVMLFLPLTGCEEEPAAFFFHESADRRQEESMTLRPAFAEVTFPDTIPLHLAAFSDVHITKENKNLLDAFAREIAPRHIDLLVVAGDLTDHGLAEEYRLVRDDLYRLGIPWYATIGNHDMYQKNGWENWKNFIGPSCYTVRPSSLLRIFFLDTSTGSLGARQFSWLEEQLTKCKEQYKIVVTHYPLYDDPFPSIYRLPDHEERYKLLSLFRRYNVDVFISGHLHTFQHRRLGELDHFIVGSMYPGRLDKGEHAFLMLTVSSRGISWEKVPLP